jgi:hypothetical protein
MRNTNTAPRACLIPDLGIFACSTTLIICENKQPNIESSEKAEGHFIKQEFLELAEVCEEVANKIDDRRASG